MGTSLRVFLVNEEDALHPLPRARYERLLRGDLGERLPEYAQKRIRCAVVVLETVGRKPVAISRTVYSYLSFDAHGCIDIAERERDRKMALEVVAPPHTEGSTGDIIDARHRFAKKRYDREFRWNPSRKIKAAIIEHIFGTNMPSL